MSASERNITVLSGALQGKPINRPDSLWLVFCH
jgi:hypothetical protein